MTPENLFNNFEGIKYSRALIESLISSLEFCYVKSFPLGDERPCEKEDFSEFRSDHDTHISFLYKVINKLEKSDYFNESEEHACLNTKLLGSILIICGENSCYKPWNTEKVVQNCKLIVQKILNVFGFCSVSKLILENKPGKIIKYTLEILRPKLLAGVWKRHPASVISYKWILHLIEQPELSHYLSSVLPTTLLLIDDFINENRITGIKCLTHIINNLTLAELQYHGHGDVSFNALLPLTRIREADMVNAVMPCLILLTSKLETDIGKKQFAKWCKFDDVLEIYLENMELESQIELRDTYVKNLVQILNVSSFEILRWTKRLLRIFKEYLETAGKFCDDLTLNLCLKAVAKFMELTKTARTIYANDLLFILLNALYYFEKEESEMQKENNITILNLIKELNVLTETEKKDLKVALKKNSLRNLNYQNIVFDVLSLN